MSLGFEQAGFDVIGAVDFDPIHVQTYSANFPVSSTLRADLSLLSGEHLRSEVRLKTEHIDLVFGGPPCGGFSLMGKRCPEDPRNQLVLHFARLVAELTPRYFVMENVEGALMEPMTEIVEQFIRRVDEAGYSVITPIRSVDASDFGVPQRRRRVFIIGHQRNLPVPEYPIPTRSVDAAKDAKPRPTVWDAIGDLPSVDDFEELLRSDTYARQLEHAEGNYAKTLRGDLQDPEDLSHARVKDGKGLTGCLRTAHTSETVRRFAATEPGTYDSVSRFYRLASDGICPTLRAGSGPSRGSFTAPRPIHPFQPRCITVREGARLHSFPDWFRFHPTKWHGFRQVGNSVPPLLARAIGNSVRRALAVLAES